MTLNDVFWQIAGGWIACDIAYKVTHGCIDSYKAFNAARNDNLLVLGRWWNRTRSYSPTTDPPKPTRPQNNDVFPVRVLCDKALGQPCSCGMHRHAETGPIANPDRQQVHIDLNKEFDDLAKSVAQREAEMRERSNKRGNNPFTTSV